MILGLSLVIAALVAAVILLNVKLLQESGLVSQADAKLRFTDAQVRQYQDELKSGAKAQQTLCSTILGLRESLSVASDHLKTEKSDFNKEKDKLEQNTADLSEKLTEETEARKKILSQKKSGEVRLGQIAEKLAPFLKDFTYNPENAIFLGQPIDYVVFEDDEVIFVEIKSGKAQLSPKQRHIKKLIENNCVSWKTMRIA
jgi:predicted Holliday junction resolvase-like endonuclease